MNYEEEGMFELEKPVLAYRNGTSSGSSGTDTSRDRAKERDANGKTSAVQQAVLNSLKLSMKKGRTQYELDEELFALGHHGTISGAVSNLHKKEIISRLAEKRGKNKVYVMPYNVAGRVTETQGRG